MKTDITVVLDRSGSMHFCREEAENGVNIFIKEQQKIEGVCVFSLVQFDTKYEFIHKGIPIEKVPTFKLVPGGMTALLDAVGRAINETGERLAKMEKIDRPGLVIFLIVTDGRENASKEFKKNQIKGMIEHQQSEYKWQFTFLGANQDAFAEAQGLGIPKAAAAFYSTEKSDLAFQSASNNVGRMRYAAAGGQSVSSSYTNDEREKMVSEKGN